MKHLLLWVLLFTVTLFSCQKEVVWVPDGYGSEEVKKPEGEYVADKGFKLVAYCYTNRDPQMMDVAKLKQLTNIHFAFLNPNADGTLKPLDDEENFKAFVRLAQDNGVKAAIALSGSEAIYSAVAADATLRKKLIGNIVKFAVQYGLDGVDIDWEYPRANKGNDVTFELFISELSAELHSWHKYLSMAVTAGLYAGPVKEGITQKAIEAVDFVSLMAYDGIGTDSANPNHHSTYAMAERVLNIWLNEKQLPKEKAVLGLPVYGKNANNTAMPYATLVDQGADPTEDTFEIENITFYYNGTNTIKSKTTLARSSANGVMFWELYQDADGSNSLISAASTVQ